MCTLRCTPGTAVARRPPAPLRHGFPRVFGRMPSGAANLDSLRVQGHGPWLQLQAGHSMARPTWVLRGCPEFGVFRCLPGAVARLTTGFPRAGEGACVQRSTIHTRQKEPAPKKLGFAASKRSTVPTGTEGSRRRASCGCSSVRSSKLISFMLQGALCQLLGIRRQLR